MNTSIRFQATFAAACLCFGSLRSAEPTVIQDQGAPSTAAIVLGVGSPVIDAQRSGTSIGIAVAGSLYLFDAGPGVERRLMEASPKLAALGVKKLGPVFISHLHMDHTLGLAALMSFHNLDRKSLLTCSVCSGAPADLDIYGPGRASYDRGIGDLIAHLQAAFPRYPTPDEAQKTYDIPVRTHDIAPGVVYKDPAITVTAFEVPHKTPIAYGFRLQTKDRVIVISGDERPTDAVANACNGCDMLFHEVFGLDFGPDGPTGSGRGHTSALELGELAARARPKHLVIYHSVGLPVPAAEEAALSQIRKAFAGKVTFSRDLDVF